MATMDFISWRRAHIVAESQPAGGRLGRSIPLSLDDTLDNAGAQPVGLAVAFPAASDVKALRPSAIRHMAPKPNTPDAETTKCVHVDLHDADLPWRYTPEPPAGDVHKPWMVLLVGTDEELSVNAGIASVEDSVLAAHPLESSHKWAHVQSDGTATFSRILSPYRLKPQRSHVAALVPAFTAAGGPMWNAAGRHFDRLPAYFSWRFQAAEEGDFETLARALRAAASENLGIATLHYERPLAGVSAMLTLGGAITSLKGHPSEPAAVEKARNDLDSLQQIEDVHPEGEIPVQPDRWIMQLPDFGNLWTEDTEAAQWSKSMNDDPRHRGSAGLGIEMAVLEQEALMAAAVEQAGALQDAGQRVAFLAAGLDAARRVWDRRLPDAPALRLRLFGPAMGRMVSDNGRTVLDRVTDAASPLDAAIFSSAAQRMLRDGTALSRFSAAGHIDRASFLDAANTVPPKPERTPDGLPHADAAGGGKSLEEALGLKDPGDRLWEVLDKFAGAKIFNASAHKFNDVVRDEFGLECSDFIPGFFARLPGYAQQEDDSRLVFDDENMLGAIDACRGSRIPERPGKLGLGTTLPRPDRPDPRRPIDPGKLSGIVSDAIDPNRELPPAWARVKATISGLDLTTLAPPEAPIGLDYPTWTLLNKHEREWLLPGAGQIKNNSVVGLRTNPTFIDSFLVGINTQFLAEMRWRNLPAPRVSTPLRMFWGYANANTGAREPDIRPIGDWPSRPAGSAGADDVGDMTHQNARPGDTTGRQDLVIAFRTPLFRRYPSTLTYLVRPGENVDDRLKAPPDFTIPPNPVDRWCFGPIFFGVMEPDLVFFAFDVDPDTLAQYWVVLDEPPMELRFRSDKGWAPATSADTASAIIDHPTRVAISGAALAFQAGNG